MTTYRATVHLLFDVDHGETEIPDALNSILTENMRKYTTQDSCLLDWSFASNGDALECIDEVELPEGYEPDENAFPYPPEMKVQSAALDMFNALDALLCNGFTDRELARRMNWPFDTIKDARDAFEKAGGKIGNRT